MQGTFQAILKSICTFATAQHQLRSTSDHATSCDRIGMSDSQLFADIRQLVRERLCISAEADPEQVAQRVAASVYAQDYHIDNDTIRNLRTRSVDVLWKLASRDVDSVKQAVCVAITLRISHNLQCTWNHAMH
jgi:hypothetical protein